MHAPAWPEQPLLSSLSPSTDTIQEDTPWLFLCARAHALGGHGKMHLAILTLYSAQEMVQCTDANRGCNLASYKLHCMCHKMDLLCRDLCTGHFLWQVASVTPGPPVHPSRYRCDLAQAACSEPCRPELATASPVLHCPWLRMTGHEQGALPAVAGVCRPLSSGPRATP